MSDPFLPERVTVTDDPTPLWDAAAVGTDRSALIRNRSAVSVDLGGSDVATGEGFEFGAGETVECPLVGRGVLYAVTASGTARLDVLIADA